MIKLPSGSRGSGSLVILPSGNFAVLTNQHVTKGQEPKWMGTYEDELYADALLGEVEDYWNEDKNDWSGEGSTDLALISVPSTSLTPEQMALAIPIASLGDIGEAGNTITVGYPASNGGTLSYIEGTNASPWRADTLRVAEEALGRGPTSTGGASGSMVYGVGGGGRLEPVGLYFAQRKDANMGVYQQADVVRRGVETIERMDADGDGIPNHMDAFPGINNNYDESSLTIRREAPAVVSPGMDAPPIIPE